MSILNTILKTFVGDKSKKDIRAIQHLVDQINKHQLEFEGISNDELREKTAVFKAKITETRKSIDQQISELNTQLEGLADIDQREDIYNQIDLLEKSEIKSLDHSEYKELFHYFLIPGLILFLTEIIFSNSFLRRLP